MTSDHDSNEDAPPSEEELAESARLRDALDKKNDVDSADADLLDSVRSAAAPRALDEAPRDAIVHRALVKFDAKQRRSGVVIRVAFGTSVVVAAAAAAIFYLGHGAAPKVDLARARSTQSLFSERFESRGGESARIDRIAVARAADLRENHFARWGVRDRGRR